MKQILFPSVNEADAFIADLQQRGAVQPEVGHMTVNRSSQGSSQSSGGMTADALGASGTSASDSDGNSGLVGRNLDDLERDSGNAGYGDGTAEEAGAGAVKGTVAGAVVGAAAAVVGTAVTVGTGGLALPVVLGMTALGSGIGAGVGAIGGAAGVDETGTAGTGMGNTNMSGDDSVDSRYDSRYQSASYRTTADLGDDQYNKLDSHMSGGGRAVAVDDNVPQDVLDEAVRAHHGQYI